MARGGQRKTGVSRDPPETTRQRSNQAAFVRRLLTRCQILGRFVARWSRPPHGKFAFWSRPLAIQLRRGHSFGAGTAHDSRSLNQRFSFGMRFILTSRQSIGAEFRQNPITESPLFGHGLNGRISNHTLFKTIKTKKFLRIVSQEL